MMAELSDADRYAVDGDQDHLPALTVGMYRAFLARGKRGMEALQVYLHLLFTYRLQKTDSVYAVNSYIQHGICMGEHRVKAAKSLLRSMGLIQAVRTREKGRIVQNYTRLNLLPNPGLTVGADSAPPATVGAVTARVENRTCGSGPQMLEEEIRLEEEKKLPPGGESKKPCPKNGDAEYPAAFEVWWTAYPRKTEKRAAFAKWKATLKKGASEADLLTAVHAYAAACAADGRESKYIKHPATFLGPAEPWREYLGGNGQPAGESAEQAAAALFGRG